MHCIDQWYRCFTYPSEVVIIYTNYLSYIEPAAWTSWSWSWQQWWSLLPSTGIEVHFFIETGTSCDFGIVYAELLCSTKMIHVVHLSQKVIATIIVVHHRFMWNGNFADLRLLVGSMQKISQVACGWRHTFALSERRKYFLLVKG